MSENQTSYRKIMKSTSIFGGVQIFTILISILRSKFIALYLGSAGIGIVGLLNSTIGLIGGITNFGLNTSAVRDVALANSSGDDVRIGLVVSVLRKWVWITGLLGALVVLVLAPWLSRITFGNSQYIWSFALVSVTLFFNQLNVGQLAILQGMQKIRYLAKASLAGNILGLLVTVPIYYFFKIDGIVPALILASIISFIISVLFAKKVQFTRYKVNTSLLFSEGKNMMKMGFFVSLSGLFVIATTYITQIFISKNGGVEQVGLFTAGFAIINTYMGLVFNAMGTDYFPRLSAVAASNNLCKITVNQQAEVSVLILGPIIMMFLVLIKLVIIVLYSNTFIPIEGMVSWLALAIFLKAVAWCIGFIFLAKGDSRIFFCSELAANFYMLLFYLLGYYFAGLTGLGISFFLGYLVCLFQVLIISKVRYQFSLSRSFLKIFAVQFLLAICCFVVMKFIDKPLSYFIGSIIIVLSICQSYKELDKRLGIKGVLNNFLETRIKK